MTHHTPVIRKKRISVDSLSVVWATKGIFEIFGGGCMLFLICSTALCLAKFANPNNLSEVNLTLVYFGLCEKKLSRI